MSNLVQIGDMPPLHQSTETVMSCALFYIESIIKGNKQPGGMESARGKQVHKVGADYAGWCSKKGVAMDLEAFDLFAKGAGPAASKILVGMRDSYQVDFAHFFAAEVMMSLDDDFHPTCVDGALDGVSTDSGRPAAYRGTLDALYIFRSESKILIDDLKTHMRPYEPSETLQGRMYALLTFQHFPWVQEVRFRLIFTRYRNLTREVVYARSDLPSLVEAVRSARARQQMLHDDFNAGRDIEATAGSHCLYCPMLSNKTCPISNYNANMQLTPEDRLNFSLWYSQFNRVNSAAMKDYVNGTGRKITLRDFNKKAYVYGPVEKESHIYPLFKASPQGGLLRDHHKNPILPIIDLLLDHVEVNPDDTEWLTKISISGTKLESYLKAKSRAALHQAVTDTADAITKVTLKVSKPLDVLPPDEEEDNEFDEDLDEGEF